MSEEEENEVTNQVLPVILSVPIHYSSRLSRSHKLNLCVGLIVLRQWVSLRRILQVSVVSFTIRQVGITWTQILLEKMKIVNCFSVVAFAERVVFNLCPIDEEHARNLEEQWIDSLDDGRTSAIEPSVSTTLLQGLIVGFFFPLIPFFFLREARPAVFWANGSAQERNSTVVFS